MDANSVDILLAGIDDEPGLVPLMAAFNQAEGIVWKPESMTAALRQVLRDDALGLILVARDRSSCATVGYGLATFGYDLEFAGRDAFITELFVEPANRGQGLGLRHEGIIHLVLSFRSWQRPLHFRIRVKQ
jgi:GNAT superfamily N-acetyltransferase